jgi:hypothetical protein
MQAEYNEIGGYDQRITRNKEKIIEITCTCMWSTMEMSRHPNDYKTRRPCKHIKELICKK